MPPAKLASARRSLWHRVRFQLGIGMLLAVILPYALRFQFEPPGGDVDSLHNSLLGTLAALVGGYYAFRRVSHYPGVRASYHILPSFAVAYLLALAVFFFARLDYSRLHFVGSFLLCVVWYYVVYFKLQRQQRLRIGVVPAGAVEHLFDVPDVAWVRLSDDVKDHPFDAIVADLRADIPDQWERFLADRALAGTLIMHYKQMEESLTGRVAIDHSETLNTATRHGAVVLDQWGARWVQDWRMWDSDRIHLTAEGHRRTALAAATALGLRVDDDWRTPLPPQPPRARTTRPPCAPPSSSNRSHPRSTIQRWPRVIGSKLPA